MCTDLWLDNNNFTYFKSDVFTGLQSLETLYLHLNGIWHIEPGSFTNLKHLKQLYLHQNKLILLDKNIFSLSHENCLTLLLWDNPFLCDTNMCWIKKGEHDGWIKLTENRHSKPDCYGVYWDDVMLNCSLNGRLRIHCGMH